MSIFWYWWFFNLAVLSFETYDITVQHACVQQHKSFFSSKVLVHHHDSRSSLQLAAELWSIDQYTCAYTRGKLAGCTHLARCRLGITILAIFLFGGLTPNRHIKTLAKFSCYTVWTEHAWVIHWYWTSFCWPVTISTKGGNLLWFCLVKIGALLLIVIPHVWLGGREWANSNTNNNVQWNWQPWKFTLNNNTPPWAWCS